MSTSPYSPTESSYWSSPRLKIPIKAVNLDFNHNVGVLQVAASGKSLSEPSSPQLWHKGTQHFFSCIGYWERAWISLVCMLWNSAVTILVSVSVGTSAPSMRSTISTGYPAPLSHITNSSTSHRNSPLNLIGEGYISSSNSTSRSISPSSDDSDKWSSYRLLIKK